MQGFAKRDKPPLIPSTAPPTGSQPPSTLLLCDRPFPISSAARPSTVPPTSSVTAPSPSPRRRGAGRRATRLRGAEGAAWRGARGAVLARQTERMREGVSVGGARAGLRMAGGTEGFGAAQHGSAAASSGGSRSSSAERASSKLLRELGSCMGAIDTCLHQYMSMEEK
ncbi:hypothetical protein PVAP13_5KG191407 [Panicum virgatum]|uniref:Uncharacterized protein n=1 Tax=Panicum virgatum TaxID=38727 RepID=A0A8T0SLK0_PANVG|nr:hypothetical protein PVAP13_5KG191407 [Panicum virgatum]